MAEPKRAGSQVAEQPVAEQPMAEPHWRQVAARATSLLLRYPDAQVLAALPILSRALDEVPLAVARALRPVAEHRAGIDPGTLAEEYVRLFDFRRRCCLHLTYYTAGDTRRRGEALVGFAEVYRAAGVLVADGELPDYLPAVLDLAAGCGVADGATDGAAGDNGGWRLLREHRVGLELLHRALADDGSVYQHAAGAIATMLPQATPAQLAAAAMVASSGPPTEQVGLEPYGLVDTTGARG